MTDTQKVKVTNLPVGGIWLVGWMFTLGYIPLTGDLSFWEIVGKLLFTYLIWPLQLGIELSSGGL
jgi:hypothetical protein